MAGTLAKETGFVMSSSSGKHSEHRMSQKSEAARVVAKLLASRPTPLNEIPHLIESVERALMALGSGELNSPQNVPPGEPVATAAAARDKRSTLRKASEPRSPASTVEKTVIEKREAEPRELKPVPPTLLRRAEVIHVAPVAPPPQSIAPTNGTVRGVVQWFDTRTNRGTLRLQGLSTDLPVDGDALAASGLTRLFKGQEIEVTLEGGEETPKVAALRLLNLSSNSPVMGGMVRDRHAKQVVVELKREALSRAAARAEAELLLPSRRAR
jgi:cold shock CspA family protein